MEDALNDQDDDCNSAGSKPECVGYDEDGNPVIHDGANPVEGQANFQNVKLRRFKTFAKGLRALKRMQGTGPAAPEGLSHLNQYFTSGNSNEEGSAQLGAKVFEDSMNFRTDPAPNPGNTQTNPMSVGGHTGSGSQLSKIQKGHSHVARVRSKGHNDGSRGVLGDRHNEPMIARHQHNVDTLHLATQGNISDLNGSHASEHGPSRPHTHHLRNSLPGARSKGQRFVTHQVNPSEAAASLEQIEEMAEERKRSKIFRIRGQEE